MLIEVVPSSKQIDDYDLTAKIAVVFDVLRATSTIVTALALSLIHIFAVNQLATNSTMLVKFRVYGHYASLACRHC